MRKFAMLSILLVLGSVSLAPAVPTPAPLPPKGPALNELIAPKMVKLNLTDVSVVDAVAELAKQSGYVVQLDNQAAFAGRKISLQTGDVTFFQALDQLCAKAGLVETNNFVRPLPPVRPGGVRPAIRPLYINRNSFMLTAGTPVNTPTAYAGALRIRIQPQANAINQPGQTTVTLEVTAEPRLVPFNIMGNPEITKAIDDLGQALTLVNPLANVPDIRINPVPPAPNIKLPNRPLPQPRIQPAPPAPQQGQAPAVGKVQIGVAQIGIAQPGVVVQPGIVQPVLPQPGIARYNSLLQRLVTIRLKKGDKDSRSIRELSGTLHIQVQKTEPVTIDNVTKAKGQKASSKDKEVSVILDRFEKVGDVYHAQVIVEQKVNQPRPVPLPAGGGFRPGAQLPNPAPGIPVQVQGNVQIQAQVQVQVKRNVQPLPPVPAVQPPIVATTLVPFPNAGFPNLVDAQGRAYQFTIRNTNFMPADANGIVRRTYTMEFRAGAGQGEPTRLVLNHSRMVPVDVPFTLENVPVR